MMVFSITHGTPDCLTRPAFDGTERIGLLTLKTGKLLKKPGGAPGNMVLLRENTMMFSNTINRITSNHCNFVSIATSRTSVSRERFPVDNVSVRVKMDETRIIIIVVPSFNITDHFTPL